MNSTELLAAIRRHHLGPTTTLLATDDTALLAYADAVIQEEILPELIDIFEEFLVQEVQVAVSTGITNVVRQTKIRIPGRAYNTQVRGVSWRQSANENALDLEWINRNDKNVNQSFGRPTSIFIEGDFLVVNGDTTGVLDIAFMFRPGELVTAENFRQVTAVDTVTGDVTLDSAQTDWTTANTFDIHSSLSSGQIANWDLTASAIVTNVITFTPTDIDGSIYGRRPVQVGDYVVLQGKAAQPMIPEGLHGTVALGTVLRIASSLNDTEEFGIIAREYQNSLRRQIRVLDQRYEQKHIVINRNSRFRRVTTLGLRRRIRFF